MLSPPAQLRTLPHARSGAPVAAAGDRLLSGGVRATLPTRIEIGAQTTTVPATVTIPWLAGLGEPVAAVGLYDDRGDPVAGATVFRQSRQADQHLELAVSGRAVGHPGEGSFAVVPGGRHRDGLRRRTQLPAGEPVRVLRDVRVAGRGEGRRPAVDRHRLDDPADPVDRLPRPGDHDAPDPVRAGLRLTTPDTGEVFGAITASDAL